MKKFNNQTQNQCLKYGQTIFINPGDDLSSLCITGDGFIKTKALMFEVNQNKMGAGCVFFQSLFKIFPSFTTSKLDMALNIEETIKKKSYKDENKLLERIQIIEENVILEYKMNLESSEKLKDTPLSFSQSVQFLHIASNKFLACNYDQADIEQQNFKLELTEFPSVNTCFRLIPAFTHQTSEDGLIFSDSCLYIAMEGIYIGIKPYLHVGVDQKSYDNTSILLARTMFDLPNQKLIHKKMEVSQIKFTSNKGVDPENILEPSPNSILTPLDYKFKQNISNSKNIQESSNIQNDLQMQGCSIKREINVSLEKKSYFILKIYTNHIQDENVVCFGDVLWFHHLQKNAILVTTKNLNDEIVVNLQPQSQNDQQRDQIGHSNGMWQIEHENLQRGGIVEWGQALRLRHSSLGKYLAVKTVGQSMDAKTFLYLSDSATDDSLLAFFPLPSDILDVNAVKYVTKDSFLKLKALCNGKSQWIQFLSDNKQTTVKDNINQDVVMYDNVSVVMVKLNDQSQDEDVLKCYIGTLNEILEQSFLISCFPIMRKTLQMFKTLKSTSDQNQLLDKVERVKFRKKIGQFQKVLTDLNKFCNNQLINSSIEIQNNTKLNQTRQKVLNEQYFIEVLIEILKQISYEAELLKFHEYHLKQKNSSKSQNMLAQISDDSILDSQQDPIQLADHQNQQRYFQIVNQKVQVIKNIYRLLTSICKDNSENEQFVFHRIMQFQYQAKFIKETTHFITSFLQGNLQLLNNLTNNVRIKEENQIDRSRIIDAQQDSPSRKSPPNNLVESVNVKQIEHQKLQFGQIIDRPFNEINQTNNIVLFYKQILEDTHRSQIYFEFFSTICKYQHRGIRVNQEIINKFKNESKTFQKSLLMKIDMYQIQFINCEDKQMRVEVSEGNMVFSKTLNDKDQEKQYLISQLNLYADLAMGRNYLWRTQLEKIFPRDFVFNQIFDQSESIEIRSAFCRLAYSVYVDREPYNKLIVPNLCRLLNQNQEPSSQQINIENGQQVSHSIKNLVDQTHAYMLETCQILQDEMIQRAKDSEKNRQKAKDPEKNNEKNYKVVAQQNNMLTLNILKLAKTLIKFDILTLVDQSDQIKIILPSLIELLEFDRKVLALPYILYLIRKDNLQKAKQSQNRLVSTFKGAIGEALAGIYDIAQFVANSFVSKSTDSLEDEFSELQTTNLGKNPIIKSLITVTNQIQTYQQTFEESNSLQAKQDIQIKLQVCELLIFFQEQRLDYLISNFICFFCSKGAKIRKYSNVKQFEDKFNQYLMADIQTVIPTTLRTGIVEIDNYQKSNSGSLFTVLGNMIRMGQKRFKNYCGNQYQEIQDLDNLMSGQNSKICKAEILPSLIVTLYITKDQELMDKLIEVMRRSFSQKEELFKNLEDLEILFDQNEINCYKFLENTIKNLKIMTENSEVWLDNLSVSSPEQELQKIMLILRNLNAIFFESTEITNDLQIRIKPLESDQIELINATRQKIFRFLNGHVVLIDFIGDTQNQITKIVNNLNIQVTTRESVLDLLKEVLKILTNFCYDNEANQHIIYNHIDLLIDEIALDFGQMELICSIFKNNRQFCEIFPNSLVQTLLNFINLYGRQTRFLSIFQTIQNYKKQYLVETQLKILNAFLPHSQILTTGDFLSQNEFWLYGMFVKSKGLHLDFQKRTYSIQVVDQPFEYHSALFDVILQTSMGEESFKLNSPKLKSVFKLGYLIELLTQQDDLFDNPKQIQIGSEERKGFSILKPKIIQFIRTIYINNTLTHKQTIIKEQHSFFKVFEIELSRLKLLVKYQQNVSFDFQRFLNYFFDHLIVLLQNFSQKMVQKDLNEDYKDREEFILLSGFCRVILEYSDNVFNNTLNALQYNNLVRFITDVDEKFFTINSNTFSQCLIMNQKQDSRSKRNLQSQANKSSNQQLYQSNEKKGQNLYSKEEQEQLIMDKLIIHSSKSMPAHSEYEKKGKSARTSNQDRQQKDQNVKNIFSTNSWANEITWNNFLQASQQSSYFLKESDSEIKALAQSFVKIHKIIPDEMMQTTNIKIEFKDILKKLIKYIEFGIINKANKENLIFMLKVLEEILNQSDDLVQTQKLFDHLQATKMILNIISQHQNYPIDNDLLNQLLSFACKLTEGGNKRVQNTIFTYFSNLPRSEFIFSKFNFILQDHIDELKSKQRLLIDDPLEKGSQNDKVNQIHDDAFFSTEGSEDDRSKEQIQFRKTRQQILVRLLRFVQLLCEGHNNKLQNYVLYQFNSRNNYNLVQSIVELLYIYHFDLSKDNFDNIQMCLDTLTEFVQGPCSANQQAIIDSQFLEIAHAFLNMNIPKAGKITKIDKIDASILSMSEDKSIDSKVYHSNNSITSSKSKQYRPTNKQLVNKPQLERWMLERIKYKSMVLVASLLELNCDSLAIKRIMRTLPLEILQQNLVQIYRRYKKSYGVLYPEESLKHISADLNNPKLSTSYHEIIIETGFYIYFLICYYSDLDNGLGDGEKSSELQEIRTVSIQSNSSIKNNLRNNVLGQLILFTFAILNGIYSTFNAILKCLHRKIKKSTKQIETYEEHEKKHILKMMNQQIFFKETIQFFSVNSVHIEVIINKKIEIIHFQKLPHCHYLPDETKVEFQDEVDRDSMNAKVSALVEQSSKIIDVCKHEEKLALFFSKNQFLAIFADYVLLWKDLAFIMTILLNLLLILSFYDGSEEETHDEQLHDRIFKPRLMKTQLNTVQTLELFDSCGYVMIICSSFVVIFFLCKKAPIYGREAWNESRELLNKDHNFVVKTFLYIYAIFNCFLKVLMNIDLLYYLFYGTFAFLASLIHPFFFAFHLTEVMLRYPTLRTIIKSFWEPKLSLLLTFVLIVLVNYYFSIIAYIYFADQYNCINFVLILARCDNLLFCFFDTFDKSFKYFGGIGGWIELRTPQDPENYNYGRFFFDNLYNLIVVLILIKIFSGVIIDHFSELRQKYIFRTRDIQEICFICGYTRELFDRKSDTGFVYHTKNEHYMWNYIFYISYLKDKEVTEYNGIESYIHEKLKNLDQAWIPISQASSLQNMQVMDSHYYELESLKVLEKDLDQVKKNAQDLIKTVEDLQNQKL